MSIFEVKDTVCIAGSIGIVCYHEDCGSQSMIDLFQCSKQFCCGTGVQCTGGFICKNQRRPFYHCARCRHTLPLTAGQFAGIFFKLRVDPKQFGQFLNFPINLLRWFVKQSQWDCNIFAYSKTIQKEIFLKDKA